MLWLNASWMEPWILPWPDLEMRLYETWLCKLSAACCVLVTLVLCLIEQLLKLPRGLARGSCPPSPVRMRALVEGRLFWCYLVLLPVAVSLSLCQVTDFSMGWKLQSPINCFIQWTFVCLFFFFIFLKFPNLVKKHQHGQVSPGTSFISRFQCSGLTARSRQQS